MLALPKSTEIKKQIPKSMIYKKFQMNTSQKEKMDTDISRIVITNEISQRSCNIAQGEAIKSFFVIAINLKNKDYLKENIIAISKLIPQNTLLVLEYQDEIKLAIYHTKLIQSEWKQKEDTKIGLQGLNLDKVWENIIIDIGKIKIQENRTLAEQIVVDEQKEKLLKEIAKLEKQARVEKQPKKKFELVQQIKKLKEELEG